MPQKQYFRAPTPARIVRGYEPVDSNGNYVDEVLGLQHSQVLVIEHQIVPSGFKSARKFLKHGDFVKLKTPESLEEAVESHMFPWELRRDALNSIDSINYAGYSFRPFGEQQDDKRERRVRLVECLEAERILAYGHEKPYDLKIEKAYEDASRIPKDGARVRVTVPYRRSGKPRYKFYLDSVVLDSNDPNKFAIANGISSTLSMPAKEHDWRHNYYRDKEDSRTLNLFAHEIAAYYRVMFEEYKKTKPNISPIEMSPFPIPTKLAREYYKKLISMVVVMDKGLKSRQKLRRLNKAEQEILLWALVKEFGYMDTMYSTERKDGKLQEADWALPRAA